MRAGRGGGVDLKMEGVRINPFQGNFDPMSRNYWASVFRNWLKMHFLLHFHICCFNNNRYERIKNFK